MLGAVYRKCTVILVICTSVSGNHYSDVMMSTMASDITSLTSVYSTDYSGADQRKHQSSASLAFVRGIHRWPVNSRHKWLVTRKMFPFDDVTMWLHVDSWSRVDYLNRQLYVMAWFFFITYPFFTACIYCNHAQNINCTVSDIHSWITYSACLCYSLSLSIYSGDPL